MKWEERKTEVGDELIFLWRVLLELLPRLVISLEIKTAHVFTGIGGICTQAASCPLLLQKGCSSWRQEWRKCFYFIIRYYSVEITG